MADEKKAVCKTARRAHSQKTRTSKILMEISEMKTNVSADLADGVAALLQQLSALSAHHYLW